MKLTDRRRFSAEPVPAPAVSAQRGELALALPLRHGGEANISLRYELAGPADAPLLVVAGGISAGRHVLSSDAFPEPGWWQVQAGTLDPGVYRILAIDWAGADGGIDLPIDPADQADALVHLLDALGIGRVAAFVGASYGAMVGMHLTARRPDRIGGLLAISASDRAHPFASACRSLQRQALSLGESNGDPDSGVALARALAILTYRTPQEFAERFASDPAIRDGRVRVAAEDYLDAHGARHCRRMGSIAYRRLSESIDLHRFDPAAIKVPLTLVSVDQDALVPSEDIDRLAAAIPGSTLRHIQSRFGHDAFLKEEAAIAAIISDVLAPLEPAR